MSAKKLTEEISRALNQIIEEDHTVQKGLRDVLFESVGPLFDEVGRAPTFPLRPSSCLKPMRDLFYDLKNYYAPGSIPKKDIEPRVKLIFQFGHLTETLMLKLFSHGFDVKFEQERVKYGELIDKDGKIIELSGAIDWAVQLDSYSEALTLCDSKSIGSFGFKKAPKEDNIAQMQLYMHSDWGRANKVNNALLIYFNKDTSDIKCIDVTYDKDLAQKILDRLKLVFEYYKRDELPPREYLAGLDWQANYSSYKDYDNIEFTLPLDKRPTTKINDFYQEIRYDKDAIRDHVDKYGNGVTIYVDKKVYIVYSEGKLIFVSEEI